MHTQSRRLDCGDPRQAIELAPWSAYRRVVALGALAALAIATSPLATHAADTPPASDVAGSVITPANVPRLQLVFSYRTGSAGAHTAAPQVGGNALLVLTPFPHTIYAFDLTQPEPSITWRYTPPANGIAAGLQCCGAPSGGITLAGDHLLLATQDGHVTALQASDGAVLWDTALAHPEQGEVLVTPPTAVGDKVVVGNAGEDFGVRGWLAALDAATGRTVWKVFNTGPDSDAGIGPRFRPYHPQDQGSDLGVTSWPPSAWQQGGGGLDGRPVYDDAHHLLLYATGPPAPWNPTQRQGDNRWTSGLFARDPDTGTALWFDAISPHDQYALGASGGLIPGELDVGGRRRALLIHPDRNGYVYVLERTSGEILSVEPYLPVTATIDIDRTSGTPRPDDRHAVRSGSTTRDICPAWPAGDAAEPAFEAATGLLYIAASRLCMDMEAREANYIAGTPYTGATVRMRPTKGVSAGALIAWDVAAGKAAWEVAEPAPLRGSPLVTAGGVVFYGTLDGMLKALDARSGAILWQTRLSSGVVSRPTAFRGSDGKAWLAVLAGAGPLVGMPSASEIDVRDASAAKGFAGLLHDLPPPGDRSGTLYVFRLP
jgi:lanthanide-dependent methanol dehydrogenase